ncbi:MAG: S8 family peptidase [Bacteroidetes bacterium]|nr:S8 family peptidase [Bacteroidota bacterium]
MKKYISALFITFIVITTISVVIAFKPTTDKIGPRLSATLENTNDNHLVVWVYLNDKGPDAEQLLANPLNLVSQRSIDRRLKVKSPQDVVDMTDVPVYNDYANNIYNKVKKIRHRSKWLNAVSVEVNRTQLYDVADLEFVKQIEVVERFKTRKDDEELIQSQEEIINSTYDDPMLDSLNYGTNNAVVQITQIKVNQVHNQGIFGQGVIVANFDAGFSNLGHEVFTTLPMDIIHTWDFHNNTPTLGTHSHGTATLSLVGGYKPGKLIGPAFKSSFILARTEVDPGEVPAEMDNWIAAAEWVDSLGADIITSSLGYLGFDPPYPDYTWLDMNGNTLPITIAADLAVNKGIIVSNSAGNNGSSSHNTLNGPADGDSVITVGAVTSTGTRSSFSSVGPTTDIPARIKPDVMAMGSNNYIARTFTTSSYGTGSGTSYSCPLTSGVCALILSANKSLTPMQVRGILRYYASQSNTPDNSYGWGIIDAQLSVDSARKLDNTLPLIQHTQPFTTTMNTGIITMGAKMTDNGIIRSWVNEAPRLYYRKNTGIGWSSYSAVNASNTVADSFYFQIPASPLETQVEYYFAAQDIALPTPKMSTLPTGGSGINPPGTTSPSSGFLFTVGTTSVVTNNGEIPNKFKLYNNFPNPFNPSTKIKYDIPNSTLVKLTVYNILGKEVKTLVSDNMSAGSYSVEFNADNFSSGVYFYRIETSEFVGTKKMLLLK